MITSSAPLVLYHGGCYDGWCSAWIASRALLNPELLPVSYGQLPPDCTGREVYILDFSYPRPVMRQILSQVKKVVVLDHHRTAQTELTGLVDEFTMHPDMISNQPGSELPVIHFDMEKSGGRLTWEFFHSGTISPWLVDYTEDRDLWRNKLPGTLEINAFIRSYPFDLDLWDRWSLLCPDDEVFWNNCIQQGRAILRYQQQEVDSRCSHARPIVLNGHHVFCVNTTSLMSEIAGQLAKDRPFGCIFFIRSDGKVVWSLRSRNEAVDVSLIAKAYGGGGHRNAAGFEESITQLNDRFSQAV